MFRNYFSSPVAVFSLTLLRRFSFLVLPMLVVVFIASITESFGVTMFIPFFAILSRVVYDPSNSVIAFVYSIVDYLPFHESAAALLLFIAC